MRAAAAVMCMRKCMTPTERKRIERNSYNEKSLRAYQVMGAENFILSTKKGDYTAKQQLNKQSYIELR